MIAAELVARLRAQDGSPFEVIEDAAGFSSLDTLKKEPAAYVIQMAETAGPNPSASRPRQIVAIRFAVIVGLRQHNDRRGDKKLASLSPLRDAVKSALYGWTPASANAPLEYRRGTLLKLGQGELWWSDEYETQAVIQSA